MDLLTQVATLMLSLVVGLGTTGAILWTTIAMFDRAASKSSSLKRPTIL